jgi:hypothetical protein
VDGSHQCVDCPNGRYRNYASISATIAEESPDTACNATICDTTKRTVNGECQECATGAQMSSTTNAFLNQNKVCDECRADHYWTNSSEKSEGCTACNAGTFVDDGANNNNQASCTPRDCGTQGKGVENYDCVDCSAGYVQSSSLVSNVAGGEKECEYCAANYYADGGTCKQCAFSEKKAESTVKNTNSSKCDICQDANYFVATINASTGAQGCFKCPYDEVGAKGELEQPFNPYPGGTEEPETTCIAECALGLAINGSTGQCEIQRCEKNQYVDNSNLCQDCGPHHISAASAPRNVIADHCTKNTSLCHVGSEGVGHRGYYIDNANTCIQCPSQTENNDFNAGDANGKEACKCAAGTEFDSGSESCETCQLYYNATDNSPPKVSLTGTQCEPRNKCNNNHKQIIVNTLTADECEECADGFTVNVNKYDTTCHIPECPQNQYWKVSDNGCVACTGVLDKRDSNEQTEQFCAVSASSERNSAQQRQNTAAQEELQRQQDFDNAVTTYQGHNDLDAFPFVSTTFDGTTVKDGSEAYTVDFTENIYKLTDFGTVQQAKILGENASVVTVSGRTGQLCFEPGNRDVDCGKGFHCSNGASSNKRDCELAGAVWDSVARTSSIGGTDCASLQQALSNIGSYSGTLSGDARAGNLDEWRRQVTFAFCETIPFSSDDNPTTAQFGADTTVRFEENKCHVTKPANGHIIEPDLADGGQQVCAGDVLEANSTVECNFKCDDGYSLDRSTICTDEKILRAGTCTLIDSDAGEHQMKPDTTDNDTGPQNTTEGQYENNDSDNLEDMNKDTQYSDDTAGPYNSGDEYATADTTKNDLPGETPFDAPKCRFLPPNRIFPDALVQGQEYNSNNQKSAAGQIEDHTTMDNNFHSDDTDVNYGTNEARVRIRFNKDALTVDADNSYNYFIIHSTSGSTEGRVLDNYTDALTNDKLLTFVKINAAGEPAAGPDNNDNNHFAMDHEAVSINPNDCLYDDANDNTIQTCRPTASIKFWKRYQVVIGAASKCAGPTWSNKEHVFIRATYTVDSEFELKYAPGLNLGTSGFTEIEPGVWVRNRVSSHQPTLIMHSDYSKTMVNVAKASTTVTHASLNAFTRLELVNPHHGSQDGVGGVSADTNTNEQLDNSGNSADQDDQGQGDYANTGMCRDSHVHESHVSGFDDTAGDDGDFDAKDHATTGCLFRARMVVKQEAEGNLQGKSDTDIMKSTLAGYRLDLAMSQYAQFNFEVLSNSGIQELAKHSSIPANFATVISDPSIDNQNNPGNDAFGSDIRFDICSCNVRYRHIDDLSNNVPHAEQVGIYEQTEVTAYDSSTSIDRCGYNSDLNNWLKTERSDGRGLVDYNASGDNIDGFITTGYAGNDQVAPATIDDARKKNGGDPVSGFTYVKQYSATNITFGGIGAACTYEAFFPPQINTPFAYVRAWFKFSESTHVDHVDHDEDHTAGSDGTVNTNPTQWQGTNGAASHGNSASDGPARRLRSIRSLAQKTQVKAPPNMQHSVHFKFN